MNNIVLIELRDGRPHNVVVKEGNRYESYDFDWSKYYGKFMYHGSASWSNNEPLLVTMDYWIAPNVEIKLYAGPYKHYRRLPFMKSKLFERAYEVDDLVWCSTCGDMIDAASDYNYCPHIWWCDECGDWNTPDESCEHSREN